MATPTDIRILRKSRLLELCYEAGETLKLPFEYLRVFSPSAEVRGHGEGQEVLQVGKQDVLISGIMPVGHYAIKIIFDDGHDSGLYGWDYLQELAANYEQNWQEYLAQLEQAGKPHPSSSAKSADSDASPSGMVQTYSPKK